MLKALEQIKKELKDLELLPQTKGNLSYKQGLERALYILETQELNAIRKQGEHR
jgi:hypothetical protein